MPPELQTIADEELARQAQGGSLEAFEELVHRYGRRIYGFVSNACGHAADAQEITQDSFVKAFRAISRFDPRREFAPWIFTLARRQCIDHHRRKVPATDGPAPEQVDYDDPSELLARREQQRDLWQLARGRLAAPVGQPAPAPPLQAHDPHQHLELPPGPVLAGVGQRGARRTETPCRGWRHRMQRKHIEGRHLRHTSSLFHRSQNERAPRKDRLCW